MIHYKVEFEYADQFSRWEWRKQECMIYANNEREAIKKCKTLYGLGLDCLYNIIDVQEV